ncbi:MAG: LptF/LptG family permease [Puniceicoccales bacterium]|jgi:lipopolysaccharide export system permease protein|nr:LptF/LptG family permease [Puniceicoccales bacterium]
MKILHKYVLTEWLRAFFAAALVTAGLLLVEDVYKNLYDFIQHGEPLSRILYYYLWLLIRICPIVIPVSFFLSLLFSLGKLHHSNELTSMRAIGLNLFQITLPLWLIGGILSALSLFFDVHLSSIASQKTQDFCSGTKGKIVKQRLTFNNERDGRTWFIGELNRQTSTGRDAMIYFYDSERNESGRLFAEELSYKDGTWTFTNGFETAFDKETHHPDKITKFNKLDCEYGESPGLFFSLVEQTNRLSFAELRKILSFSKNSLNFTGYRVRYYGLIFSSLSCLLIAFITIPFSTVGVRRNPMIGVAEACTWLFVFYLTSSICNMFGVSGTLPIPLAVSLPYCLALLSAHSLYKKSI